MDARPDSLVERVLAASAAREELRIRGGGTKDFLGGPLRGQIIDPRMWSGIEAYEPSELYLTARAGTPLADIEATLRQNGQMLAFEPPHFGEGATLGGCIAAGLSGPRRFAAGPVTGGVRDHVLGATLLDGRGRVLRFGGTVMKNVAGYDVARLLAGSLGLLGVILSATLKVLPCTESECTLGFELPEADALASLAQWRGQPLPLSASLWHDGRLLLRLSGAGPALLEARRRLGGELLAQPAAATLWTGLREHRLAGFASGEPLWRIGVPDAAPPLELEGEQNIEGGGLRWLRTTLPDALVRGRAAKLGGHATLFRGGDRAAQPFAPLPAALLDIHRRIKDEFDPARIFNPGRMHPAF